jgi:hypothetical protein
VANTSRQDALTSTYRPVPSVEGVNRNSTHVTTTFCEVSNLPPTTQNLGVNQADDCPRADAAKILPALARRRGLSGAMSALAAVGICCNPVQSQLNLSAIQLRHIAHRPTPLHFAATTFWPFAGALLMHFLACMLAEGFRAASKNVCAAYWPVQTVPRDSHHTRTSDNGT